MRCASPVHRRCAAAEEPILENVRLAQEIRTQRNLIRAKQLKQGGPYDPYADAESLMFGGGEDRPLLAKYDDEEEARLFRTKNAFRIGGAPRPARPAVPRPDEFSLASAEGDSLSSEFPSCIVSSGISFWLGGLCAQRASRRLPPTL